MTRKASKTLAAAVTATVAPQTEPQTEPLPLPPKFASPVDFGSQYEALCERHEAETVDYRNYVTTYASDNFPVVHYSQPKKDEDGNIVFDAKGDRVMVSWVQYDLDSDAVKGFKKAVTGGMVTTAVESGRYDSETLSAKDALKIAAMDKTARKAVSDERVKAALALAKRITNSVVDKHWSRGPLAWLTSFGAENRATATGVKRDKGPRFAVQVAKDGKFRVAMEKSRASSETAGFTDTATAADLIAVCDWLAKGGSNSGEPLNL